MEKIRRVTNPEAEVEVEVDVDALILVRSDAGDGGWSLHAPGTTEEEIAEGIGILASGTAAWDAELGDWNRPNEDDFRVAAELAKKCNQEGF